MEKRKKLLEVRLSLPIRVLALLIWISVSLWIGDVYAFWIALAGFLWMMLRFPNMTFCEGGIMLHTIRETWVALDDIDAWRFDGDINLRFWVNRRVYDYGVLKWLLPRLFVVSWGYSNYREAVNMLRENAPDAETPLWFMKK